LRWQASASSGKLGTVIELAVQDHYPDDTAVCYGCGRLNDHGLHVRSVWEGDLSVCRFHPRPEHTAVSGYVYGGVLASLVDCHGTGTAAAIAFREEGRGPDTQPPHRFVTASLHVDYLRPTPLGPELRLEARLQERKGRKLVIAIDLFAEGELCVKGLVVAAPLPAKMLPVPG